MLVCHCKRVSDRTIRACAEDGARNHLDVGDACGAGTCCGGCRPAIDEIVAETRAKEDAAPNLLGLPLIRLV